MKGLKRFIFWWQVRLKYRFKQWWYEKAIDVLYEITERKKDQIHCEPNEELWQNHLNYLRGAIELIEEDIPYLDPNY